MASEGFCEVNLGNMTASEKEEVKKQIDRVIKKARTTSDMSQAVEVSLREFEQMAEVAAKVEKRNAYLNRAAQKELFDYINTNWPDDPMEGLMAYLVGSQRENSGARNSVAVAIEVQQNRYKNTLRAKLTKEGLLPEAKSGLYDKEVYMAMDVIHKGGDTSKFRPEVIKLAKIYDDINQMMRVDANKAGAVIGELDGFLVSRHHDMFKVRNDRQGWVDWMINNVDWERGFPGIAPDEQIKMLEKQANEFASGAHVSMSPDGTAGNGVKGFGSIAKRMSKSRVFHFKSPDLEYEYSQKFGENNLLRNVISSAEQRGRSIGMMRALGPNAEANLDAVVDKYINFINKSGIKGDQAELANKLKTKYQNIQDNVLPILTGRSMIAGSHIGATVESLVLTIQRTSALGGSAIASLIGDSGVHAYNVARMDGEISGLFKGYGEYFSGLFRNLNDPEVQDLLADLAVTNDYLIGTLPHRYGTEMGAITKAQRGIQNVENQFFFWNGQYFVDTRARASAAIGMATRFGRNTDQSFEQLRPSYKALLINHSIDADDWDFMRQSLRDYSGNKVLDVEGIRNLPEETISTYIKSKGLKDSRIIRERAIQDLIDRTRGMFQDQQGYSILAADARLRSMMFGGQKAGTPMGFVRKSFWQFKQFPTSFLQKMYGREIYSKSATHSKAINMGGIMLMSIISGYVAVTVNDLRSGKEPRGFGRGAELDSKLAMESFFRGGGAGVFGDFFYNLVQDRFGNSPVGKFLGPTYADLELLSKGIASGIQGDLEKSADNLTRLGISNVPFSNLFYVKPVLDYAILNQLQESLSPGSLARAEQRLMSDKQQGYFMNRPQDTMLFGR